jgi:hypothetical protein
MGVFTHTVYLTKKRVETPSSIEEDAVNLFSYIRRGYPFEEN